MTTTKKTRTIGEFTKHYVATVACRQKQLQTGKVSRAHLRPTDSGSFLWGDLEIVPMIHGGRPVIFQAFARNWQVYHDIKCTNTFVLVAEWDDLGLALPGSNNIPYIPDSIREAILAFRRTYEERA